MTSTNETTRLVTDRAAGPSQSLEVSLLGETMLGLSAAARLLPGHRGGPHLNSSTILRWILKGVRVADGTRVRLEGIRCGSRWTTSTEALERFTAVLTMASLPDATPTVPVQSPAASRAAHSSAARELDRLGIR